MIPVEQLKTIPMFAELDQEELAHLAPLFHRTRMTIGRIVSRQGDPGDAFYVLESGSLRVRYVDARDQENILGYLNAPAFFGETSLMTGIHRDVTIDVFSKEAELLVLPKHEFDALLTQFPQIKDDLSLRPEVQERMAGALYPWLQPGEVVLVNSRRHWYALVARLYIPAAISLALLAASLVLHVFLDPAVSQPGGQTSFLAFASVGLLVLFAVWTLGAGVWLILDWSNDFYIITNKRVVHIEKVLFFFDEREEAPIEMVTNVVEMAHGPAARIFGFADLRVETAGRQVDINFTFAPLSERIPQKIFEQIDRVRDRAAFEKRERLRAGMRDELWQRLAPERAAEREAIAQTLPPPAPEPEPLPVVSRRSRRTSLGQKLNSLFGLRVESANQVTWRKHWFVLVEREDEPLVGLALVVGIGLLHMTGLVPIRVFGPAIERIEVRLLLFAVWTVLLLVALFFVWYQYADWSNDIYRVTSDRIQDLERSPFGFRARSIETTLDRVQDVSYIQRNPVAVLFNFGDLIIETAGSGRFTFYGVQDPRSATQEIFRRRDAHRSGQSQKQAREERREFLDWFMEYHRFLQEQGEINPPLPPAPAPPVPPSSTDESSPAAPGE